MTSRTMPSTFAVRVPFLVLVAMYWTWRAAILAGVFSAVDRSEELKSAHGDVQTGTEVEPRTGLPPVVAESVKFMLLVWDSAWRTRRVALSIVAPAGMAGLA